MRFHITQTFEDIRIVECNVSTVMGEQVWHGPTEGETSCTGVLMISSKGRIIERGKISFQSTLCDSYEAIVNELLRVLKLEETFNPLYVIQ